MGVLLGAIRHILVELVDRIDSGECATTEEQDKCDIIRANQDNTQRIIDTLNSHWSDDLRQKYNDARLELSQRDQTTAIVAALKTTATT